MLTRTQQAISTHLLPLLNLESYAQSVRERASSHIIVPGESDTLTHHVLRSLGGVFRQPLNFVGVT